MILRANLIANGKYYPSGTDIPDDEVPAFAMKWYRQVEKETEPVVPSSPPETQRSSSSFTSDEKPKERRKPKRPTFVLRQGKYIPLSELNDRLISGEALYWKRPRDMGKTEAYIKFGNAKLQAHTGEGVRTNRVDES